jgi:SAM-dependent methyltransferase
VSEFAALDPAWWAPEDRAADRRHHVWEAVDAWALDRLPPASSHPYAIDVGCGRGRTTRRLAQRGHSVTALDTSPAMLEIVERMVPAARLQVGNALAIPEMDSDYDIAVSIFLVEHLDSLRRWLHELHRVLRPGGVAVVTSSPRWSLNAAWCKLNPAFRGRGHACRQWGVHALERELVWAGFELQELAGFGTVPPVSLLPGWRGTILGDDVAWALSRRLDPLVGRVCGHVVAAVAVKTP